MENFSIAGKNAKWFGSGEFGQFLRMLNIASHGDAFKRIIEHDKE